MNSRPALLFWFCQNLVFRMDGAGELPWGKQQQMARAASQMVCFPVRGPWRLNVHWTFLIQSDCGHCDYFIDQWRRHNCNKAIIQTKRPSRLSLKDLWMLWGLSAILHPVFDICLLFCFFRRIPPARTLHTQNPPQLPNHHPQPSASLTRPLFLMDFSCFIEIPHAKDWGTLIKMSGEDESGEHAAK